MAVKHPILNMVIHSDFKKIKARFIKQYGGIKGDSLYSAWIEKKEYDDTKHFPGNKERKELMCSVRGVEIKENDLSFHVEGLIATTHIDRIGDAPDVEISDRIPRETLESFANQINTQKESRIMGKFHSEGKTGEYFGEADVQTTPAKVIELTDGEFGLYVDTELLKDNPKTLGIIDDFESGKLNSFSITYDTNGFMTTDFEHVNDTLVRVLNPETRMYGYTASTQQRVANPNAIAIDFGFKEFKELVVKGKITKFEEITMQTKESKEDETLQPEAPVEQTETPSENVESTPEKVEEENTPDEKSEVVVEEETSEQKELKELKEFKANLESKEKAEALENSVVKKVLEKIEMKEQVLSNTEDSSSMEHKEVSLEVKEFIEVVESPKNFELKEQFSRAAALCEKIELNWLNSTTSRVEDREFKEFGIKGRQLEFKGLGITTNQNTDTDYLQSSAELQDIYDPVIYNVINQRTAFWNILGKDDYSGKGNNQVQFTLKIGANPSARFYSGNSVSTDNVTRLKYQTKFKKIQVGVSVDGDMVAAARGGPVSDVFAQEIMDSTVDMMKVLNAALFAEVGLETADGVIGLEYITDSAGNTTLYNLTRSAANYLAPDSASDTYINQGSTVISMTNLRAGMRQAKNEMASKQNLVWVTNPVQGDMLRGKFDDSRRMLSAKDTDFGFSTDLFVDGVPVYEDVDCNTDDWFLVDLESHRAAVWVPPTVERLGKNADSEDAFIKMYFAIYNRAPRRMVQIYGAATS